MIATFFAIGSLWMMVPLLTLIAAGTYASKGPFWALSSEWLGARRPQRGSRKSTHWETCRLSPSTI